MTDTTRTAESHFLRAARQAADLSTSEAARLVHASRRSWEGWESGSRPIPVAKLELFRAKLEGRFNPDESPQLVVVLAFIGDMVTPIDVVSSSNYVGLERLSDGRKQIKSLAVDPLTKRPYVHKTVFEPALNPHVLKATQSWASIVDAS